jgi:predicted O-linked N-acetylglucosamine transferase (SPINDLY family)
MQEHEVLDRIQDLIKSGRLNEAIGVCESLEKQRDLNPQVWYVLGMACWRDGMYREAEQYINRLLRSNPGHAVGWAQMGLIHEQAGRNREAADCFIKSIRLAPDEYSLYRKLESLLSIQGRKEEARRIHAEGLIRYSRILFTKGQLGKAFQTACDSLDVEPDNAAALTVIAAVQRAQGKPAHAEVNYRKALDNRYSPALHSDLLLCLNYIPGRSMDDIYREHRCWESMQSPVRPARMKHANDPDPGRRLRIGYVSPDLRESPVSYFFRPLIQNHDKTSFEIICYDTSSRPADTVTGSMRSAASRWRTVQGLDDAGLFEQIKRDGVDILVDLAGHTPGNSLTVFLRRPAPLQVTYLGYANTTGISTMDYRFTDSVTDPEGTSQKYREKLVRMKAGLACYSPPQNVPDVVPPPVTGNGYVTFGSLNNLAKINDHVIDLWARVLRTIPSARMIVFRGRLVDPDTRRHLLERFTGAGIAEDRISLAWRHPSGSHWEVFNQIDIMLDTFPWNAHTIACESLWMGVPVITLKGDRHSARLCASVLTQAGLAGLVANTRDEFIDIACDLSGSPGKLAEMRIQMRGKIAASPLCDAITFARGVEAEYRKIWESWCARIRHGRDFH